MTYTEFIFTDTNETDREVLIALLSEIGFTGFEEEEDTLKACIPTDKLDENLFDSIEEIKTIKYSRSIIQEKNWNEEWEANFEPVSVNDASGKPFAFIRASFHEPDPSFTYDIIVTPKMSFGTGHHHTTYLMTEQMSSLDIKGKTVIDFGTGTGILGILAEKMGAKSILAIDCDDWSIDNAKENFVTNGCHQIELIKAETIPAGNVAGLILANINLNIIIEHTSAIKAAAQPGANILFSGIMLHDEKNIINHLTATGFNIKKVLHRGNWLAILASVL